MPSGIEFTYTNILQFASFITPFTLGFFLVMSSIFNQDLKGFVYLGGVLMSSIINILLQNVIRSELPDTAAPSCRLIKFNIFSDTPYNNPNISSSFIAFTIAYLLLPMVYNNQMNYVVVVFLLSLFLIDTISKIMNNCTSLGGALIGSLVGFILGAIWFSFFFSTGNNSLLYFNEFISNNVVCNRPSKQSFKCSVYKNGKLIDQNIT